jgi:hypothetical protein
VRSERIVIDPVRSQAKVCERTNVRKGSESKVVTNIAGVRLSLNTGREADASRHPDCARPGYRDPNRLRVRILVYATSAWCAERRSPIGQRGPALKD